MCKLYIWLVIRTKDNEIPKANMGKIKHYSETYILFFFTVNSQLFFEWILCKGATEAEPKFVFMFYDASQLLQTYLYIVYCAHILYISHRSRGEPYTVCM
jgi:hypothetical protein